jgi:superfamily II DNA/RNA helicase
MSLMNTQRIICNGMAQLDFDEVWPGLDPAGPSSERQIESLFAPKLAELRALVRTVALEQGRKLVIFSQWRRMLRLAGWAIADVLRDAGMRAVYFTGAESQKQRTRSVVELHDDRDTTVMLLSDAGGVGLNLQRAASCCINLELPWNPAVLEQRIGRIHRLGQRDPIDVYNLVSDEGIETRIAMSVANKKALFTGLFDGNSNELVFDQPGSTMAMLETLVEPAVPTGELEPPDADDESLDELDDHAASDLLERANDTHDAPVEPETGNGNGRARPPASPDAVATLLASLRISTGKRGNVIIEAPAETAGTLALLFRTMAEQLESQQHTG